MTKSNNTIPIKTSEEIEIMRQGGKIAASILKQLFSQAQVGVKTKDLDALAKDLCQKNKVIPAFKGFGGYKHNLVTCINDEVVHGQPSDHQLKSGDILTLDFGLIYRGFCADVANTVLIGSDDPEKLAMLEVGKKALGDAIQFCDPRYRLGDISAAIQARIEDAGYSVIRAFVGHGVGRELHEDPQVPGYGVAGTGPKLETGMVLAVEVMYATGGHQIEILDDGWTAVTRDGSNSGMFEHSVAITKNGPLVLTKD